MMTMMETIHLILGAGQQSDRYSVLQ